MYIGLYTDKEAESLVFKGTIQGLNKCAVLLDTDIPESESLFVSINTKNNQDLGVNDVKNEERGHEHDASVDHHGDNGHSSRDNRGNNDNDNNIDNVEPISDCNNGSNHNNGNNDKSNIDEKHGSDSNDDSELSEMTMMRCVHMVLLP
jgi:hypothetical protein